MVNIMGFSFSDTLVKWLHDMPLILWIVLTAVFVIIAIFVISAFVIVIVLVIFAFVGKMYGASLMGGGI